MKSGIGKLNLYYTTQDAGRSWGPPLGEMSTRPVHDLWQAARIQTSKSTRSSSLHLETLPAWQRAYSTFRLRGGRACQKRDHLIKRSSAQPVRMPSFGSHPSKIHLAAPHPMSETGAPLSRTGWIFLGRPSCTSELGSSPSSWLKLDYKNERSIQSRHHQCSSIVSYSLLSACLHTVE